MTRTISSLAGLVAACALTACGGTSVSASQPQDAEALRMALNDEYKAEATYDAVIEAFGEVRPFINIIEAERRHASRAKAEMDRLDISYDPVNPYLGKLEAPASLLAACEQGVEAEIENIALYDRILPTIADEAVKQTLTDLHWASRERHLPAFRRCVAQGGEMGRGGGPGKAGEGNGRGSGHGRKSRDVR